jgi:hypothetical protein
VVSHFVNLSFCQMTKISYTMWLKMDGHSLGECE